MNNLFDHFQTNALSIARRVFGYDAVWTKSTGGTENGRVLLKEPTSDYELGGVTFTPFCSVMEYHQGTFSELFNAVNSKRNESVSVNGVDYYVRTVTAKNDGKTYIAIIERKP